MKTLGIALAFFSVLAVGCAAETAGPNENAGSDEADVRGGGKTLKNGAHARDSSGPLNLRVTALAKGVTASPNNDGLATCTPKENHAASTDKKTVFDISIDYQLDDGWNGCTIEFDAPGYKATLEVGEFIGT